MNTEADLGLDARSLPIPLDAERSVLGAAMLWEESLLALEGLLPRHFGRQAHRQIFGAIQQLSLRGVKVDTLTVTHALGSAGTLDAVGGVGYLSALADGIPRSTNVKDYAAIIRASHTRREMVFFAEWLSKTALEGREDLGDLKRQAEERLFAIVDQGHQGGFVSMAELVPRVMANVERWAAARHGLTGLATGFADLDEMLGGLQPGDLVVVGARPSMGKSSLMMNIAKHIAVTDGGTVGVFSFEMSDESLALRELSSEADIDGYRLRRGILHQSEWTRLSQAIGALAATKLHIDESPNLTVHDLRSRARRLAAESTDLRLIAVDYLQLMGGSASGRDENRALEIGKITRSLKQLARELKVPILLLSQLSRALENRQDKRPMLSDLRESGAIEQDADVVLFIYREWVYDTSKSKTKAEIIVAKQRNGPLGTVDVHFEPMFTRFENPRPGEPDQAPLPEWSR